MTRKRVSKPYWEMNTQELAEATAEFDEEFAEEKLGFKPLTAKERARWERVKAKGEPPEAEDEIQVIIVHVKKKLLDRCAALAKKKRISCDNLIARGLKAILAAEGEGE